MTSINQLESLKVFSDVVECGNFTAAAKRLNMSPAWVSKCIERLEIQLGATLFQRSTRHMQITDSGERCYLHGLEVLQQWQLLEDELSHSQVSPKGKLRISAPMSWGLSKFGAVLSEFMGIYPNIVLDVQLGDQHVNVLEEKFDLVLRLTNKLVDSSLLCKKLVSYQLVACASPEYLHEHGKPSHPNELNNHACLIYTLPGAAKKWKFIKQGKPIVIYLEPRMTSNNSKLLHTALLGAKGIALIPDFVIADDLATGRLTPILKDYLTPPLNLYALRPRDKQVSYRLKLLYDFLCARLRA